MAENENDMQLEEAKKNALAELKSLQAEKGWNDEKIKEYTEALEGMSSLKDIEEYLEARRKEEKKENGNEGQEGDKPKEEGNDAKPAEENKELTPEERKAAREEKVPTDEFKSFMEETYGEGAFEKDYVSGKDEEKDRLESEYEKKTKKSPLREAESTTINEIDSNEIETPEAVNTDNSHADEPEWKKMRREAWEKYAADNQQEFKLLSEDKAPDLSMSVGDTPIKYADEHNVTMGNGEYAKFLKAVEIEKNAKTDVINFGKIESEEYKAKLAAACIQMGMRMKNGPKSIDLSLDCFKDLDDATKAKIEAYNQKQAEKENSSEHKKDDKEENKENEGLSPDEKKYREYQEEAKKIKESYKGKDLKDIPLASMEGLEGKDKYLKYAAYANAGVKVDRKTIDSFFNMNEPEIKELPKEVRGILKQHNAKQSEFLYKRVVEKVEKEKAESKDGETPSIDFNTIKGPSPKQALLYAAYKNAGFEITNAPERFDNIELGFFPKEAQKVIIEHNIQARKKQLENIKNDMDNGEIKKGQYRDKEGNVHDATFTNTDGSKIKKSEISRNGEGAYGKDEKGFWAWKQKEDGR